MNRRNNIHEGIKVCQLSMQVTPGKLKLSLMAKHNTDFGIRINDTTTNHGILSIVLKYVDVDLPLFKFRLQIRELRSTRSSYVSLLHLEHDLAYGSSSTLNTIFSLTHCPCFQTILLLHRGINKFFPTFTNESQTPTNLEVIHSCVPVHNKGP